MNNAVTIRGKVYNKIYSNTTNLFTIVRFQTDTPNEVPDKDRIFTATGTGLPVVQGDEYALTGTWTSTEKYGVQLKVSNFSKVIKDRTDNDCFAFLSSGLIKGIGAVTAAKIVGMFGSKSIEVLDKTPEQLLRVRGITKNKLEMILESYEKHKEWENATRIANLYNISLKKCMKIFQTFGDASEDIIKTDTYKLCCVNGLGFITVDDIARKQDPKVMHSDERYKAVAEYVLGEYSNTYGSLYMPIDKFYDESIALFNDRIDEIVEPKKIKDKIDTLCGGLYRDDDCIGLRKVYDEEVSTAENIHRLMNCRCRLNIKPNVYDIETIIDNGIRNMRIDPSAEQLLAIRTALSSNISIITGGAGTGKTTIIKALLNIYSDSDCILLAPTGRAAKRMTEATGHPASTIHSKLGLLSNEDMNENMLSQMEEVEADLIIVDEASMLDSYIANILFHCIAIGTKVVIVGDVNQLPSVGPGNVLSELINCGCIPTVRLEYNFRQQSGSTIIDNAQRVLHKDCNLDYDNYDFILDEDNDMANNAIKYYISEVKKKGFENVMLLSPYRQNKIMGTEALNKVIQECVNPNKTGDHSKEVFMGDSKFRVGDRVMQTKNKRYAMNGDIGTIVDIFSSKDDEGNTSMNVIISYDDSTTTTLYTMEMMEDVQLAYACTVHKSQGSEYDTVILVYGLNNPMLLKNNLFYTAITRAKKELIIVGKRDIINGSIRNVITYNVRISLLGELIRKLK